MARPPLGIGTAGTINTVRMSPDGVKPESWRARCRFRDLDGTTRPVERWGPTKAKAEAALKDACRERLGKPGQLDESSRVRDLIPIYLAQIKARRADTTYDRYKTAVNTHVLPALGALRVCECTTARIQDFLDAVDDTIDGDEDRVTLSGSYRSMLRSILRGIMQIAVRRELIAGNPGRELDRITHGKKRLPRALTAEELTDFLTKLDANETAQRADLCDLMRLLFGTGLRIGEALALRWCDLNLTDGEVTMVDPESGQKKVAAHSVWVNGNVVYVVGEGTLRHAGKTFAANRVVGLPPFLHTLLSVRRPAGVPDRAPIFVSPRTGMWKNPGSVGKSIRKVRADCGYPDLTTHWGRKTVATLLDEAKQTPRQVADLLGHTDIAVTQKHYFARGMPNPNATVAINAWHQPKK